MTRIVLTKIDICKVLLMKTWKTIIYLSVFAVTLKVARQIKTFLHDLAGLDFPETGSKGSLSH